MNDSSAPETPLARYLLLATLVCYAVVQLLWMQATPLQSITLPDNLPVAQAQTPLLVGLGPDEKEHFLYIRSLADTGHIPRPSPQYRTDPAQYVSYQAQHPPVFYALAALVYKAVHPAVGDAGVWYVLRGLCVVCGFAVIGLTDRAAKTAFPERPLVALGTAPFVAFLPMFGHMTGNLSNEPLAMVFGAAVWLQSVRLLRRDAPPTVRDAIVLGATLALACLTRMTALMWLPVVAVALLHRRERFGATLAGFGTFAALLSPWLLFNQLSYGKAFLRTFDRPLLANGTLADFFGKGIVPHEFPVPVNAAQTALWYAGTAWCPFWLTQFYQPDLRPVFLILSAAAIVLVVLNIGKLSDASGKAIVWGAVGVAAFCTAALIQQELMSDWDVVLSAGRYIVAAAPATSLLFAFALSCLRPLNKAGVAALLAALMLAFGVSSALTVTRYYIDRPKQADVQPIL